MSDATTPTPSSDESDIAYLKRLAVAGRGEPAPFLLLMAVFGGAYGGLLLLLMIGFLVEGWPDPALGRYTPGPVVLIANGGIIAAHLAFLVTLIWTAWRTLGPNRIRLNRTASATWTAAFIGLVTVFVAIRLFAEGEPPSDVVYSAHLLGPVLLVLWGSAWWVTAMTSDRPWLLAVAIGSYAAAVAMASVANTMMELPIICACLLLLAFVPAVVLMRQRAR